MLKRAVAALAALLIAIAPVQGLFAQVPMGPNMVAYGTSSTCNVTTITLQAATTDPNGTLSNGDLTLTSDAGNLAANIISKSNASDASGNYYFEFEQTEGSDAHGAAGWANATQTFSGDFLGDSANSFGFLADSELFLNGGSSGELDAAPPGIGHVYGIAVSLSSQLFWETSTGTTWNTNLAGTQNPATGQGGQSLAGLAAGPYFPSAGVGGDTAVDSVTVNFGATPFTFNVPAGFSPVQAPCNAPSATAYSMTGPTSGTVGTASSPFTVTSNGNLTTAAVVTPSDGNQGGSFTPGTCTLTVGNATSCTFTYTAVVAEAITISASNSIGLINPNPITYTASSGSSPATAYSLSGPSTGSVGNQTTPFTVTSNGSLTSAVIVTPNSSGEGGTFSPSTCTMAIGVDTSCTFVFTPTTAGTYNIATTNSGTLTNPSPISFTASALAAGFYISPSGSDNNACTLAAPCASVAKCQTMMEGSSTKTCYLRAGTYSQTSQITLGSSDAGETWSYYPSDGIWSAILDGGSSGDGTGVYDMFVVGTTGVSFIGLKFQNIQQAAIDPVGVNHGGVAAAGTIIQYCFFLNFYNNGTNGGPVNTWGTENVHVLNNVFENMEAEAINAAITQSGDNYSGWLVSGNAIFNADTVTSDMGALYVWDGDYTSGPSPGTITWTNNYINNYGSSANFNKCLYLDDAASGSTLTGNICVGTGEFAVQVHGGNNNIIKGNIFDLGSGSVNQYAVIWQGDGCCEMTGNTATNNLVINYGSSANGAWYNNGDVTTNPTVTDNMYFNYTGGPTGNTGSSGYTDSNPTVASPGFTVTAGNWTYPLPSGAAAFNAPVSFPPFAGGWGPSSFSIPTSGVPGGTLTEPSYFQ